MKEQIVITDSLINFEKYCTEQGRDRSNTIQVSQPFQLAMYPDAEIVFYGDYGLNPCYGSRELNELQDKQAQKELEQLMKEKSSEA